MKGCGDSDAEHKFIIYNLDRSKKCFVGQTTIKVLDLALSEIFARMVLPSDGIGPKYVGKIDPK